MNYDKSRRIMTHHLPRHVVIDGGPQGVCWCIFEDTAATIVATPATWSDGFSASTRTGVNLVSSSIPVAQVAKLCSLNLHYLEANCERQIESSCLNAFSNNASTLSTSTDSFMRYKTSAFRSFIQLPNFLSSHFPRTSEFITWAVSNLSRLHPFNLPRHSMIRQPLMRTR